MLYMAAKVIFLFASFKFNFTLWTIGLASLINANLKISRGLFLNQTDKRQDAIPPFKILAQN